MLAKFYQQIQVIMTILGYYEGKCDGAWGPQSIEAMRKWEMTDSFEPAIPMNGKPFVGRGRLPEGIMYGPNATLMSEHLTSEKGLELLKTPLMCLTDVEKAHGKHAAEPEQKPQYVHVETKQEQPVKVEQQVDHTASAPLVPEVTEVKTETPENKDKSDKKDNWLNKK